MEIRLDLPADLINAARSRAATANISVEQQIETWVRRGIAVDGDTDGDEALEPGAANSVDQTRSGPT